MKEKHLFIITFVLLFFFVINNVSADDDIITDALSTSSEVESEILDIERFYQQKSIKSTDKKIDLLNELKSDARDILHKKTALNSYIQNNNVIMATETSTNIIEKSDKIHAYHCLFEMILTIEESTLLEWRLFITGKDNYAIKNILMSVNDLETYSQSDYRLHFSGSHEDYTNQCKTIKNDLYREINEANRNLMSFDLGVLGGILLTLTIAYLFSLALFELEFKRYPLRETHKNWLILIISTILFSSWGLWYVGPTNYGFVLGVTIISLTAIFIWIKIFEFLKPYLNKDYKKKKKTPLEKIRLGVDYNKLFLDEGIETIEELIDYDLKELNEITKISVEKLIKIKNMARKRL
jgi:hypothetical protein